MKSKLLGCDYDGTLFVDHQVADKDIQAIKDFRKQGNLFGMVTGRCLSMIVGELKHFGIEFDFLVLCNGGYIVDAHLNTIYKQDINPQVGLELLRFLEKSQARFGVTDGNRFYRYVHPQVKESLKRPFVDEIKVDLEILKQSEIFTSFFYRHQTEGQTKEGMLEIEKYFSNHLSYHYNNGTLDINGPNVSKENGLRMVEEHFNTRETFTIGDNHNDVQMLKTYYGFAMEHGVEEAKSAAKQVVRSVHEAIEKMQLI